MPSRGIGPPAPKAGERGPPSSGFRVISMRLFIAIFPPTEIRESLASSTSGIRVEGGARWVRSENIHLTLKFLGEVSDEAEGIASALREAASRHAPFELAPSGFGGFPSERKTRVIWAGAKGDIHPLRDLAEDVEASLEPLGFERESRRFSPHFTLGRAKRRPVKMEIENEPDIPAFVVEEILLIKSETKKEGAVYTPLETFRLPRTKS